MKPFKLAFMASLGYGRLPPEQAARLSMEQIRQLLAR